MGASEPNGDQVVVKRWVYAQGTESGYALLASLPRATFTFVLAVNTAPTKRGNDTVAVPFGPIAASVSVLASAGRCGRSTTSVTLTRDRREVLPFRTATLKPATLALLLVFPLRRAVTTKYTGAYGLTAVTETTLRP